MGYNAVADERIDNLRQNLLRMLPANMEIKAIEETPMEGVYVVTAGTESWHVYSVGDYVMIGDYVYDTERKVNLVEERRTRIMAEAMAQIPESEMIVMGEPLLRYVTVFTDTDCVFCQKFHKHVPELQSRGMQVRYLMFPRRGLESESYKVAVSVWCSEDQGKAMTIAKSGGTVETATCDNPVAEQYNLARTIGLQGTPVLVLDNGTVIQQYMPPDELLAIAEAE